MKNARRVYFALSIALLWSVSAVAYQEPKPAKIHSAWNLHIDEVEPAMAQRFETLSQNQSRTRNNILKEHKLPPRQGYEIATSDFVYLSFFPRLSPTEAAKEPQPSETVEQLLKEKVDVMDDAMHAALRTHYNQIWLYDEESSYISPGLMQTQKLPTHLLIHSEWIKPTKLTAYDAVIRKLREALVKMNQPVACLVFYVASGDGSHKFIWHAADKERLLSVDSPEKIFLAAFSKSEAEQLIQQWRECLIRFTDVKAMARPDLSDLAPSQGWFGMPVGNVR